LPLEPVLVLLLRVLPVQEQIQILKDALEGIVQWMALGLHGHPGAVAADPVVKEQSPECVPVRLPRLGGSPA